MTEKEQLSIISIEVMVQGKGGDERTKRSSIHNRVDDQKQNLGDTTGGGSM